MCRTALIHLGLGVRLMTVEEEIEMLEGAKEPCDPDKKHRDQTTKTESSTFNFHR